MLNRKKVAQLLLGNTNLNKIIEFRRLKNINSKDLGSNVKFKNLHADKRCFIIGNGPSINSEDLSLLKNEITFTVNQMPRNPNFKEIKTDYHIWSDEDFFKLNKTLPEDMELLEVMKGVNTEGNSPEVFYKYSALSMINEFELSKYLKINYFQDGLQIFDGFNQRIDFTRIIPSFTTVVHYTICLAIYMGFKEIYLLGCDCTGFITYAEVLMKDSKKFQYGYEVSENEKKRMKKTYVYSMADVLEGNMKILHVYEILNKYCKKRHIQLMNCTNSGVLDCLERKKLEDVLK